MASTIFTLKGNKKVRSHPNMRIDLQDFDLASSGFTEAAMEELLERFFLTKKGQILEGFHIEIGSAGQITVYNGTAIDRDGSILHNRDDVSTTKSVTLTGSSTTFYVELEFTETETDTDARGFWDPTYSGNNPPGKEFSLNVATRISRDWKIVTPVSTSGFDVTTNPASTKIPLAVFTTDVSNEITTSAGLVQVAPSTVLEEAVSAGATVLKALNTRIFPETGTATINDGINSETITITANEEKHGWFVVAPTTNAYAVGARIQLSGGSTSFVRRRNTGLPDASTHPDVADRLFQANETRGKAVISSPITVGGRADTEIENLKDFVDGIGAIVREIKFGSTDPSVTSSAPPTSYATTSTRWVDRVGSLAGARLPSISVGTGTTSFGDFNGTTHTTLTAAIDALPSTGGILYLKRGTYTCSATVSLAKNVLIIGESVEGTIINGPATAIPAFTISPVVAQSFVGFENLTINRGAGQDQVISVSDPHLLLNKVQLNGALSFTNVNGKVTARECVFDNTAGSDPIISGTVVITDQVYEGCLFLGAPGVACSTAGMNFCTFNNCKFFTDTIAFNTTTAVVTSTKIENCHFEISSDGRVFNTDGVVDGFYVSNCAIAGDLAVGVGVFEFSDAAAEGIVIDGLTLESGTVFTGATGTTPGKLVSFRGQHTAQLNNINMRHISDVVYLVTVEGTSLTSTSFSNLEVSNCIAPLFFYAEDATTGGITAKFTNCACRVSVFDEAVYVVRVLSDVLGGRLQLNNCSIVTSAQGNMTAISVAGTLDCTITGCTIATTSTTGSSSSIGIITGTNFSGKCVITGNSIDVHNSSGSGVSCVGIQIHESVSATNQFEISSNTVEVTSVAPSSTYGILCAANKCIISGNSIYVDNTGATTTVRGIYVSRGQNVISGNNISIGSNVDDAVGLYYAPTTSQSSVTFQNNLVNLSDTCTRGIECTTSGGGDLTQVSILNNIVRPLVAVDAVGIFVSAGSAADNVNVSGNQVFEGTFDDGHSGIVIEGSGSPTISANVVGNSVTSGDLGGAVNRSTSGFAGAGIVVRVCNYVNCSGNSVDWLGATITGHGIRMSTCIFIACNGNVVRPAGTTSDTINIGLCTDVIVTGNIVTGDGRTGVIDTSTSSGVVIANNRV